MTVVCTKNNLAAPIAAERRFRIGPDEDGRFTFVPAESSIEDLVNAPDSQRGYELMRIQNEVVELVKKHARRENRLSQTQLEGLVNGRAADVRREAQQLAASRLTGARSEPGPRSSIQYFWVEPPLARKFPRPRPGWVGGLGSPPTGRGGRT